MDLLTVNGEEEAKSLCLDEVPENNITRPIPDVAIKDEEFTNKANRCHCKDPIVLNVGGTKYHTSLNTLRMASGSIFEYMFSGKYSMEPSSDGSYFFDRDGPSFIHILNFLRNQELHLPDDKFVRKQVIMEASYYGIQAIIDALTPPPLHPNDSEHCSWLMDQLLEKKKGIIHNRQLEVLERVSRITKTAAGILRLRHTPSNENRSDRLTH